MIYTFKCENCLRTREVSRSMQDGPPKSVVCTNCRLFMQRDWQADAPMIDTSACRDHDDIPEQKRAQRAFAPSSPEKVEARFKQHIQERRKQLADGGNQGSFRHSHSVPADLYHGKIKETGDKNYWSDPKNLDRHKSCKVAP